MTTGRINQIAWLRPRDSRPPGPREGTRGAQRPRARNPRRGQDVTRYGLEGANERPATADPGRRTGGTRRRGHPCAPTVAPQAPVRTQGVPPGRPGTGAVVACGIRASGGGSGPRGHADERRLPRGGSPRESGYQDWPAANDPQTPAVPGTKRPPGFGHPQRGAATPGTRPGGHSPAAGGRPPPFLQRGATRYGEPPAPPVTERQPAWQGRMQCGGSRRVPPVGGPRPSSLPHILSGYPWAHTEAPSAPGSGPRPWGAPPIRGHRAGGDSPIQSGPPTFAPYPGGKGPWALQPAPSGRRDRAARALGRPPRTRVWGSPRCLGLGPPVLGRRRPRRHALGRAGPRPGGRGVDVWMYGCVDVWTYGCVDVSTYGCVDVSMYGCRCVCVCVRVCGA